METIQKTIELIDGYTRKRRSFRVITLEEVIGWSKPLSIACAHDVPANSRTEPCGFCDGQVGFHQENNTHMFGCSRFICGRCSGFGTFERDITPSHVWFLSIQGQARRAKVNGKVRTWKRDTRRVELPVKYGLYEYATFDAADIGAGRLLDPID